MNDAPQPAPADQAQAGRTQINWADIVRIDAEDLIDLKANLISMEKFKQDVGRKEFHPFFSKLLEVFDDIASILTEKDRKEIEAWIRTVDINDPESKMKGREIADRLLDANRLHGFMKIFEKPIDPPFMMEVIE